VELNPQGNGVRHPLTKDQLVFGSDPRQCDLVAVDDPFVSPVHATVQRGEGGRWFIKNARSLNGLWVRIEQVPLEAVCEFQVGEQRLLFKLP